MKQKGIMRIKENADAQEQHEIELTVDFAGASDAQMAEWAFANRKIAFANMLRENWSESTIAGYVENGVTVLAVDASKKVESKEQLLAKVQALLDAGIITKADLV